RIQRREDAANSSSHDRSGRFSSLREGDPEGKTTVWHEGTERRRELLRGWPRRFLAASGANGNGNRKYRGGRGIHRSESSTAAGEDGSDGCAEAGTAISAVLAGRTRRVANRACAEPGKRR